MTTLGRLRTQGLATRALAGVVLFGAWTAVVRLGISAGSRHTAWTVQPFGTWPASLPSLAGSSNMALSIHATYDSGGTFGWTAVGVTPDFGDPANINGSRFVTGASAGAVISMSAHVAPPIDPAPHNQFELAIYADDRGAPGKLLAHSERGTLTASGWNSVPIRITLAPRTPYWLMYNTNGSIDAVNNLTLTPLVANPLDSVVHAPRARSLDRVARLLRFFGHPVVTVVGILLAVWPLGSERTLAALVLAAGLGMATALELLLKLTVFAPYGAYPGGHVLRAAFLATVVIAITHRRSIRAAVLALAVLSSLASISTNSHYAEEAVGGALAGWALATASLTVAAAVAGRARQDAGHASRAAIDRRVSFDRRHGERRSDAATVATG